MICRGLRALHRSAPYSERKGAFAISQATDAAGKEPHFLSVPNLVEPSWRMEAEAMIMPFHE